MCMLGLRIANRLPNRFNPVFVQLSEKDWASREFLSCKWNLRIGFRRSCRQTV